MRSDLGLNPAGFRLNPRDLGLNLPGFRVNPVRFRVKFGQI